MLTLSFIVTFIGTSVLCFSMRRHELILFSSRLPDAMRLSARIFSAMCLVGAMVLASLAQGAFIGITTFFAFFTVTVLVTAFSISILE